jgi:hypothetical protein
MDKDFTICTNTSKKWSRVVLIQDGAVITYASQKITHNEKLNAKHDLDLVVVMLDLKLWKNYLVR